MQSKKKAHTSQCSSKPRRGWVKFIHPGCYATATVLAQEYEIEVPFHPVHIFEYLLDQMAIRKDEARKIDTKIAYHRPCASRLNPEIEPLLDELFDLIGIERVTRKYDHFNTLCCITSFPLSQEDNRM